MADYDPKAAAPAAPDKAYEAYRTAANFLSQAKDFAKEEGALCMLSSSTRNSDGTVFVQNGTFILPKHLKLLTIFLFLTKIT